MARNLAAAGLDTRAWNRTAARAATARGRRRDGVRGPGRGGARRRRARDDALGRRHRGGGAARGRPVAGRRARSCCRPAPSGSRARARLAEVAAELGLRYVDAPVQGTRQPAEQGTLVVLASGPGRHPGGADPGARRDRLAHPVARGGRGRVAAQAGDQRVRGHGDGRRWPSRSSVASGARTRPATFLDAIAGGPLESPFVAKKGRAIARAGLLARVRRRRWAQGRRG